MRFYPDFMPPFEYEPTSDRFAIQAVDGGRGQGVVALVPFQPGDIVFRFTGFFSSEITQFSLQYVPGLHLHDPFFMGKVLHSCSPNTWCDMTTRTYTAVRAIAPGECVTMDYEQTEDVLYRAFHCSCGAPNCRDLIQGRLVTPEAIRVAS